MGRGRFGGTKRPLVALGAQANNRATSSHPRTTQLRGNETHPLSLIPALQVNARHSDFGAMTGRIRRSGKHEPSLTFSSLDSRRLIAGSGRPFRLRSVARVRLGVIAFSAMRAMTFAQELKLTAALSALVCAAYFPAALLRVHVSDMAPPPPGAVRQLYSLEKLTQGGFAWIERSAGYRRRTDIQVYEDNRPLRELTSILEVDNTGHGTFAQEDGAGIVLSSSDDSNVRRNNFRYWLVIKPAAPR
jgi:hypothetical protein